MKQSKKPPLNLSIFLPAYLQKQHHTQKNYFQKIQMLHWIVLIYFDITTENPNFAVIQILTTIIWITHFHKDARYGHFYWTASK